MPEVSRHGRQSFPLQPPRLSQIHPLGLPHKLAGTGSNRLFIVQQRQVDRRGSQAANIDKEQGRDLVTHSRKTWMRADVQHLGLHITLMTNAA